MGYCDQSACRIAYTGLKIPNGLVRGRDGLIYVPSTVDGTVTVFKLTEKHLIEKFNEIKIPFPIDNLSVDCLLWRPCITCWFGKKLELRLR